MKSFMHKRSGLILSNFDLLSSSELYRQASVTRTGFKLFLTLYENSLVFISFFIQIWQQLFFFMIKLFFTLDKDWVS